jgi:hypothetical protein
MRLRIATICRCSTEVAGACAILKEERANEVVERPLNSECRRGNLGRRELHCVDAFNVPLIRPAAGHLLPIREEAVMYRLVITDAGAAANLLPF